MRPTRSGSAYTSAAVACSEESERYARVRLPHGAAAVQRLVHRPPGLSVSYGLTVRVGVDLGHRWRSNPSVIRYSGSTVAAVTSSNRRTSFSGSPGSTSRSRSRRALARAAGRSTCPRPSDGLVHAQASPTRPCRWRPAAVDDEAPVAVLDAGHHVDAGDRLARHPQCAASG